MGALLIQRKTYFKLCYSPAIPHQTCLQLVESAFGGLFSDGLYNHTRRLYRSVNNMEVLWGVHTLWTDEQLCVMYVCFVRFHPTSDGLFCGLVPSIAILIHFVVYLLPAPPPLLRTRDTATLVKKPI